MSVTSISSSNASLYAYQWNNQQLQGSVASNAANSSSKNTNAYSYEGTSTVSSMVQLAKFAMEAMGVSSNDRVTFKQIEDYKRTLEAEFSTQLNDAIQNTNISDSAAFTVSLSAEGNIQISSSHEDQAKIQAFFDVNPTYVKNLRQTLDESGFEGDVEFSVSSTGAINSVASKPITEEIELKNTPIGSGAIQNLQSQGIVVTESIFIRVDGTAIVFEGNHPQEAELEQYIRNNPQHAAEIKASLEGQGLSVNSVVVIDANGRVSVTVSKPDPVADEKAAALQEFLQNKGIGEDIKRSLKNMGIAEDVDFRLTVVDGKVVVNSTHPDADKVQALIDSSEEITKAYLQVDALAGLEGARKAMQIDPTAMRKRIQMESLVAWWDQTGTSSIGTFSSGNLSSFTGVNSVA